MSWNEELLKAAMPYIIGIGLSIATGILGWLKDRWNLPKPITRLLANKQVMELIVQGVAEGAVLSGKMGEERREYVRKWVKGQLSMLLGEVVPDSAINFLIEKVVADRKAAEG